MKSLFKIFTSVASIIVLAGCAGDVTYTASEFRSADTPQLLAPKKLIKTTEVRLDTQYKRTLKAESQWLQIGTISQGDVYKPYKDVFTLEGAHVHEAYLVVANDKLVGFYLPVERSFSSLSKSEQISLTFH